mmetsp:Transcript_59393/g.145334  ORF Transcript_59393/g.145334 Transcript_59393/m.145334 type:complete len:102 (-) Transcript_59393:686-991(-)
MRCKMVCFVVSLICVVVIVIIVSTRACYRDKINVWIVCVCVCCQGKKPRDHDAFIVCLSLFLSNVTGSGLELMAPAATNNTERNPKQSKSIPTLRYLLSYQ